jgi:uncharacterized membrane protein
MSQSTTHPLVAAYLQELDRLLAGIDPGDRAEVMSGVREHLEGALGTHDQVDEDAVRAALAELGPPQAVADEAYAGRPAYVPTSTPRVGAMSRPWVPVTVAILTALGLLLVVLVAGTAAGVSSSTSTDSTGRVVETAAELSGSPLLGSFAAIVAALPLWAGIALLVGLSPLWVGREKVVVALLVPAAALLMGILPLLGWSLVGINGVYAGAWTALALVVAGGGWLMAVLTRRASARAALAATG